MTKQNSDNATQANNLSSSATNSAAKGNDAMGRMKEAINRIKPAVASKSGNGAKRNRAEKLIPLDDQGMQDF